MLSHSEQPAPRGGDHLTPPSVFCHLLCPCQARRAAPRLTLCGLDADTDTTAGGCAPACCVVCWDLGRTVLVARRCERCPT